LHAKVHTPKFWWQKDIAENNCAWQHWGCFQKPSGDPADAEFSVPLCNSRMSLYPAQLIWNELDCDNIHSQQPAFERRITKPLPGPSVCGLSPSHRSLQGPCCCQPLQVDGTSLWQKATPPPASWQQRPLHCQPLATDCSPAAQQKFLPAASGTGVCALSNSRNVTLETTSANGDLLPSLLAPQRTGKMRGKKVPRNS
jgi:hypothetical protein